MKKTQDIFKKYTNELDIDQTELYENPVIKYLFGFGHKFITRVDKKQKTVVDLGSGIGHNLPNEDLQNVKRYICVDKNIGVLNKITFAVEKIHASIEEVPLPNESVDIVIASHVLEHVLDIESSIKEITRILKQDGVLLVVLPCDPGLLWNFATLFTPSRRRLKKKGLNYDDIMKSEHVNSYALCKEKLTKAFKLQDLTYYPFILPSHNLNLLACIKLTKLSNTRL